MKIFVIILNFNGLKDTLECIESLGATDQKDIELNIVIVDNNSSDGSVEVIRKKFPTVTVLVNGENLGFAQGNNVGIAYALKNEAQFVWLLNNDTTVARDALQELVKATKSETTAGIYGAKIYFSKGAETHKERYKKPELGKVIWYAGGLIDWNNMLASHRGVDEVDAGQYNTVSKTQFITGCSMFIKREVFEKVGLLDGKLYLYYEDVDFCKRVQEKGFELVYIPTVHIWHKNAGTSGGSGSDLHSYYMTRNRLIIGMRYAPWRTKLALWREGVKLMATGTPTQRKAVGDFLRKKYGKRT